MYTYNVIYKDAIPLPVKTGPKHGARAFSDEEEAAILHHARMGANRLELAVACRCSDELIRQIIIRAAAREKDGLLPTSGNSPETPVSTIQTPGPKRTRRVTGNA